jgi:hypothetical protein
MSTSTEIGIRELDRRRGEGFEVALLWDPETNRVFVALEDERRGTSLEVDVDPAEALDAFHHPYAYASRAQVDVLAHAA